MIRHLFWSFQLFDSNIKTESPPQKHENLGRKNKNKTDFIGPYGLLAKRLDSLFSFFLNRPYHSIQENLRHTIRLTSPPRRHKRSAKLQRPFQLVVLQPLACVKLISGQQRTRRGGICVVRVKERKDDGSEIFLACWQIRLFLSV